MITQSKMSRLQEPSTWAAIAALLGVFSPHLADAGIQTGIAQAGAMLAGLAGVFLREKANG